MWWHLRRTLPTYSATLASTPAVKYSAVNMRQPSSACRYGPTMNSICTEARSNIGVAADTTPRQVRTHHEEHLHQSQV